MQRPESSIEEGAHAIGAEEGRLARHRLEKPAAKAFSSLLVALSIIVLQVGSWGPLFSYGVAHHLDEAAEPLITLLDIVWIALPGGCLYGLYLGVRSIRNQGWNGPALAGVTVNVLYFLVGAFSWLVMAAGVSV